MRNYFRKGIVGAALALGMTACSTGGVSQADIQAYQQRFVLPEARQLQNVLAERTSQAGADGLELALESYTAYDATLRLATTGAPEDLGYSVEVTDPRQPQYTLRMRDTDMNGALDALVDIRGGEVAKTVRNPATLELFQPLYDDILKHALIEAQNRGGQ